MDELRQAVREIEQVLIEKNRSYGDSNLLEYGVLGLLIRISDKLARIRNALTTGELAVIEDALLDIAGYGINGYRLLKAGRLSLLGRALEGVQLKTSDKKSSPEDRARC